MKLHIVSERRFIQAKFLHRELSSPKVQSFFHDLFHFRLLSSLKLQFFVGCSTSVAKFIETSIFFRDLFHFREPRFA